MSLISDRFPALNFSRKRDRELEANMKKTTIDLKVQPEDNFVLKVVQLQELFEVRHSVFVLTWRCRTSAGASKMQVQYVPRKTEKLFVLLNTQNYYPNSFSNYHL